MTEVERKMERLDIALLTGELTNEEYAEDVKALEIEARAADAARAMLAALKEARDGYVSPHDQGPRAIAIRAAIAQAEAAGIKAEG